LLNAKNATCLFAFGISHTTQFENKKPDCQPHIFLQNHLKFTVLQKSWSYTKSLLQQGEIWQTKTVLRTLEMRQSAVRINWAFCKTKHVACIALLKNKNSEIKCNQRLQIAKQDDLTMYVVI